MTSPSYGPPPWRTLAVCLALCGLAALTVRGDEPEDLAFFEAKIRPVLVNECLKCHNREKHKGSLVLDHRDAMLRGGDTGPAVVPGKPAESLLLDALRHESLEMPPERKLSDDVIANFARWIERGAVDPRPVPSTPVAPPDEDWDKQFEKRLSWWSLQPIAKPVPPAVRQAEWPQNEIDRFILAALEAKGLAPAGQAGRRTLARRLSFALVGLPPRPSEVEQFVADMSPEATASYVDRLLASEHFGERWARHFMDVIHYADTHGYEWDVPAKNAWMFRDYLVRALNSDVPYRQLILEMLAGDLLPGPRLSPDGLNESLLGPMALRLGERRHGDDGGIIFQGVTQQAFDNTIDTISKSFLATTVSCAQCHNHKLDAISQHDYYALYGTLVSSRFVVRSVDTTDPNASVLPELKDLKARLRQALAAEWRASCEQLPAVVKALEPGEQPPAGAAIFDSGPFKPFESLLAEVAGGMTPAAAWKKLADQWTQLHTQRIAENAERLQLVVDFTTEQIPAGWQLEGLGMRTALVRSGELAISDQGNAVIEHLLPAGRWTHVWSSRLGGTVRSPIFSSQQPASVAVGFAGALGASITVDVDDAMFPEADHMAFIEQPNYGWLIRPTRVGEHRVYLEFSTKLYNNNFPPRIGLGRDNDVDPRSWFGVTRIYAAANGQPLAAPADELGRFESLFAGTPPETLDAAAERFAIWIRGAIERWQSDQATDQDAQLLNALLATGRLPNSVADSPKLAELVDAYRALAATLQPDRAIGSIIDLHEGSNERVHVRGSYTEFGEQVPRGNISLLDPSAGGYRGDDSGRLQLAESWTGPGNPLAARVAANRVWHYLFGAGLVRTVDDFGHLGETPSHPELLDYLATRFVAEGWSIKKLVRIMVLSATWQQTGESTPQASEVDPENRLWHCCPPRRIEAEAIRDSLLAVSGRLDARLYGPPIEPFRASASPDKRLSLGPLDGNGRRSIYLRVTLMEPPKSLSLFNQPIPKVTTGRRDVTNVPDQALALLNDPFVHAMARHWSEQVVRQGAASADERLYGMFTAAFARPPNSAEVALLGKFLQRSAELRAVPSADVLGSVQVWQDVGHALFNLKEFIYIP